MVHWSLFGIRTCNPSLLVCIIGRWVCGVAFSIPLTALVGFSNLLLLITLVISNLVAGVHSPSTQQQHCYFGAVCASWLFLWTRYCMFSIFTLSVPTDGACQGFLLRFHPPWRLRTGLLGTLVFFMLIPSSCDGGCLFLFFFNSSPGLCAVLQCLRWVGS